jgi:hypothetical protein
MKIRLRKVRVQISASNNPQNAGRKGYIEYQIKTREPVESIAHRVQKTFLEKGGFHCSKGSIVGAYYVITVQEPKRPVAVITNDPGWARFAGEAIAGAIH